MTDMAAPESHDAHHERPVHLDEAHWRAFAAQTELEGELLLAFVSDTATRVAELRARDASPVRRIIDVGSGPGVGACELARRFPDAHVIAVDSSPAMLDRATQRAVAQGLQARVSTHLAELPGGLDGIGPADVIWASMALHHVGDEVAALRRLGDLLDRNGLIAIAERSEPMRVLPSDLDLGRRGLVDRLERAGTTWFASMRDGLTDSVPSTALPSMLTAAGFDVIDLRHAHVHLDAPLSADARRVVLGHLRRAREQFREHLDDDDLQILDVLTDADDPRGVMRRSDVFLVASRQILIARPLGA
jgi:SAM-dependent methyltransferase